MGNAYDYSIILNQDMPRDYTTLDMLMIEIKKLALMKGCNVRHFFAGGYYLALEIKCNDDPRIIKVEIRER